MSKIKSRLLLIAISISVSIIISVFISLLINDVNIIDFFKILFFCFFIIYLLGNIYTRFFLYTKLKEISEDFLPEKDISQTITTSMEELAIELKDYDSKRKNEFSEMKKQESFRRDFIGNLAHEIKTPLFTSQSYICLLYTSPSPRDPE